MRWVASQYLWQLTEHVAAMPIDIHLDAIDTRLAHWLVLSVERTPSTRLHVVNFLNMTGLRGAGRSQQNPPVTLEA